MARYVLVESRDPFESRDVPYFHTLATDLAAQGEQVTLFLVQNGVLAARTAARGNSLGDVLKHDVEVLVDRFSLRERGIGESERFSSVKPCEMDDLVDRIMAFARYDQVWHW